MKAFIRPWFDLVAAWTASVRTAAAIALVTLVACAAASLIVQRLRASSSAWLPKALAQKAISMLGLLPMYHRAQRRGGRLKNFHPLARSEYAAKLAADVAPHRRCGDDPGAARSLVRHDGDVHQPWRGRARNVFW